jgi:hypothetical protein
MLSSTLIRNQVVEVRQPSQKCLLTAAWMVKRFHHEEFPLDGVVGLIQQGAGDRHLQVFEDGIPPRFLLPTPAPDALAVGRPRRGGDVIDKVAEPLTERHHALALPLARPVEQGVGLRPE